MGQRILTQAQKDQKLLRQRIRRREDGEKTKAYAKKNHAKHASKRAAYAREYRRLNREKIAAAAKRNRLDNPERVAAINRKSRAKNAERAKATSAVWRRKNPEIMRIQSHTKRARKRKSGGCISVGLSGKLFKLQRGMCPCCSFPLGDDYHLDHKMPLALGGTNTDDNMQLLRAKCNLQKNAKHPVDFMQSRGFLL